MPVQTLHHWSHTDPSMEPVLLGSELLGVSSRLIGLWFPRIPRCCHRQSDSKWRTVCRFSRTVWRCTAQVQLRQA